MDKCALIPVSPSASCTTFFVEGDGEANKYVAKLYFIHCTAVSQWFYQKRVNQLHNILKSLSSLSHSSLPVYCPDIVLEPDVLFGADFHYVRRYIKGTSLDAIIPRNKAMHPRVVERNAWKLLHDLSSALLYMHSNGDMCHGNIKPQNIIHTGECYVFTDAGIYPHLFPASSGDSPVHPSMQLSRCYQPKEFQTTVKVNASFDIWSLGCVLCEFLAGDNLYGKRNKPNDTSPKSAIVTVDKFPYSITLMHLLQWMLAKEQHMRVELADLVELSRQGFELVAAAATPVTPVDMSSLCTAILRKKNLSGSISTIRISAVVDVEVLNSGEKPKYLQDDQDEVVQRTIQTMNQHKNNIQGHMLLQGPKDREQIHELLSQVRQKDAQIEKLTLEVQSKDQALVDAEKKVLSLHTDIERLEKAYARLLHRQHQEPGVHPACFERLRREKAALEEQATREKMQYEHDLEEARTTIKQLTIELESRDDALDAVTADLASVKQELNSQNISLLRNKQLMDLQTAVMNAEMEKASLRREILAAKRDVKVCILMRNESIQSLNGVKEQLKLEQEQVRKLHERCVQLEGMLSMGSQEQTADSTVRISILEEKVMTLEATNTKIYNELQILKAEKTNKLPPPPPYIDKDPDMHLAQQGSDSGERKAKAFLKRLEPLMHEETSTRPYRTSVQIDTTPFIMDPRLIPVPVHLYRSLSDTENSSFCTLHNTNYTICGTVYQMSCGDTK